MYTVAAALMFLVAVLLLCVPFAVMGWVRDSRERVIARQIQLTDAIHAELGAAAAPLVSKRTFGPWRVTYTLPLGRNATVDRIVSITYRVLGHAGAAHVEIVFTPRQDTPRLQAA